MSKVYCHRSNQNGPEFVLPHLPFRADELEPYMSKEQIDLHYGKHHLAYVNNLNGLLSSSDLNGKTLEELISFSYDNEEYKAIFNNSAQIWNHSFFWHCLKKNGGGEAVNELAAKIVEDFGSFEKFREEFTDKAMKVFGSGWCWLVMNEGKLKIVQTSNAANPISSEQKPILTLDVWEHAYYPDHQNRRADFIKTFFDHLANWDFANEVFTGHCSDV
jgi:Fe-Mn family superoxide dismutase